MNAPFIRSARNAGGRCRALHVYLGPLGSRTRGRCFTPRPAIEEPFDFDSYLHYVRAA